MTRLYRLLLLLFPPGFRRRFGDDMAAVFEDRWRAARRRGLWAAAGFWRRSIVDSVHHGFAERRLERRLAGRERTMFSALDQDLRYGLRMLRTQPTVTIAAVATLAVGIGASTAVFSVADALLFKALPYPAAERLVVLTDDNDERGISVNVALPNFEDWRASVDAIDAAAAWQTADVNLVGAGAAERVPGAVVAGDFFDVVGVTPSLGRLFGNDEAADPTAAPVAVVSEPAWRRLFERRRDVLGQTAVLDGTPHTIVGVVPAIAGMADVEVWRPVARTGSATSRRSHGYRALARLRPGVTLDEARAQFDVVAARLAQAYPESNEPWRVGVTPLHETLTEDLDQTLLLLAGAAGLLLLIACTNVAGLLVARAADRRREFAVRAALGAPRRRIVSQVLTEGVLLSLAGAAAGLVVASWSTGLIASLLPVELSRWREPSLSPSVLAFATGVSLLTGIVFGLGPALGTARPVSQRQLRDGATVTSVGTRRVRHALVFVQVTLAAMLLVGAGLLATSLWRVLRVDPGFDPRSVLTFRVTPAPATHADDAALMQYFDALLARLSAMPQVDVAAAISSLPLGDDDTIATVRKPDEAPAPPGETRWVLHQVSTPGYMRATGTRLVAGRDFTSADRAGAEPVTIVNQKLAGMLWPGESPIGRELMLEPDATRPHRVVGLIADVRHLGLDRDEPYPQYFVPLAQAPVRSVSVALKLRASLAHEDLRATLASVDPSVPLYSLRTLDDVASSSLAERTGLASTVAVFGASAVLLAAIGLYGTVATGVRERRREIGIRVTLGASGASIVGLFVRRAATVAAAGIAAGLVASYWATGLVEQFLFGVEPLDAATLSGTAALLLGISLLAAWLPSRRAAALNPVEVLKD
jgi:putative ABC transport system permease protein